MYIEPNTNVKICRYVHLDPTYQHTIYFANATAQYEYFASKAKYSLSKLYFTRYSKGVLRVQLDIGDLYDCNYLMFQNASFSEKWFYAFITRVEYANNGMSLIYFTIDIMQTWFFDYEIMPSFVLREHAMTDVAGDNIVPEDVVADVQYINGVNESRIICEGNYVLSSVEVSDDYRPTDPSDPHHYDFLPGYTYDPTSGLSMPYEVYAIGNQIATPQALLDFIQILIDGGQAEALMGIVPYFSDVSVSLSRPSSIGGYTPRNKKLLTGQYCRYTFELCGNKIEVPMDVVPNPVVTSIGKNSTRSIYGFTEYRVYLSNYAGAAFPTSMSIAIPVSAFKWAYNDYANTVALQNEATAMMLARENVEYRRDWASSLGNTAQAITDAGSAVASVVGADKILNPGKAVGDIVSSAVHAANVTTQEGFTMYELGKHIDVHSEAISRHHANMKAPQTGGSTNANKLLCDKQMYLSGYVWTVLRADAERIDKYFDMYGYATNQVKTPNRNGRKHFNYVKTAGIELHANCPQEDAEMIKKIYENGITFWNYGDEVGSYTDAIINDNTVTASNPTP